MTYAEKLRDPRWQQRRLKILERDQWTCRACGDTTTTLNVHHRRYVAGKEPWEAHDFDLVTLCESCHSLERDERADYLARGVNENVQLGFLYRDLEPLNNIIFALGHGLHHGTMTSEEFELLAATVIRALPISEKLKTELTTVEPFKRTKATA